MIAGLSEVYVRDHDTDCICVATDAQLAALPEMLACDAGGEDGRCGWLCIDGTWNVRGWCKFAVYGWDPVLRQGTPIWVGFVRSEVTNLIARVMYSMLSHVPAAMSAEKTPMGLPTAALAELGIATSVAKTAKKAVRKLAPRAHRGDREEAQGASRRGTGRAARRRGAPRGRLDGSRRQ